MEEYLNIPSLMVVLLVMALTWYFYPSAASRSSFKEVEKQKNHNLKRFIHHHVNANEVMIFSKSSCTYCAQLKELLQQRKIHFKAIELDQLAGGRKIQQLLEDLTKQSTVPNVFVDGQHIGGYSDVVALENTPQWKQYFPHCETSMLLSWCFCQLIQCGGCVLASVW